MRIKRVELNNFKRFTRLVVEDIPPSAKLIVLVGPNGSGKTSLLEAFNHYYKIHGHHNNGDHHYLSKIYHKEDTVNDWYTESVNIVNMDFHDMTFSQGFGTDARGHFYFRSAYRNEPAFQLSMMQQLNKPTESIRLTTLNQNDQTVSGNYQRLIANTVSGLYDDANNGKSVQTLREELIGKIQLAIEHIFEDLRFSSVGKPLENGTFFFTKGTVEDFSYQNLSAGEKAAFDLILDMVVQSEYYPDAIYCIDEPESHMHTRLQGKVLRELYRLVPENSQLWISTHSIGMLKEAETIETEHPHSVIFLDFDAKNFDDSVIMKPSQIGQAIWNKFYELAFGDFAKLILPECIVFCEGSKKGKKRQDFDKKIYTKIFENTHPNTVFISGGSCSELLNIDDKLELLKDTLLKNIKIIKLIDRDDSSEEERLELQEENVRVLSKRHLEAYLLDNSIIKRLCEKGGKPQKYEKCLEKKRAALNTISSQGKPIDDIKSAKGLIYNDLKKILCLQQCGNTADTFLTYTMAPLITPDTEIYKQLERDIFGAPQTAET